MNPILHILTNNSAVGVPDTREPNPLLGMKNPSGRGAFLGTAMFIGGAVGATLINSLPDATVIGGESPSARAQIPVAARLVGYNLVNNEFGVLGIQFYDDAIDISTDNLLSVLSAPYFFNGVTSDKARSASASVLSAFSGIGAQVVSNPGEWAIQHTPAAATQATITRAAGGAGVRHICRSITCSILATAAQGQIILNLRDGASGAGTILWSAQFALAAGTSDRITLSGLNIVGSANTAMTLETAAAPAATNFASVSLTGYDAS